jgi:hypothetical protein
MQRWATGNCRAEAWLTAHGFHQRLLELAPAERLRKLKQAVDRRHALDYAAILTWYRGAGSATPPQKTRS